MTIQLIPGPIPQQRLFESEKILEVQISGEISKIIKDRKKKGKRTYHPAKITYKKEDGSEKTIDVSIGTRGIFRLDPRICNFPPLMLKFKKSDVKKTIFKDIKKLKLVTHCQIHKKIYEDYVIREYLVYKLFNIFTEKSFRVRLARISYIDTARKSKKKEKFGFFIEPVEMMASRNNARYLNIDDANLSSYPLDSLQSSFLSVFQFMIGNTDWSFVAEHNVKWILPEAGPRNGVPYDFDFSGIVNTPYAMPTIKKVKSTSTKDRYYQGFCQPIHIFEQIFARFNNHKQEIYSLYKNSSLISDKYKKDTIKFLDEFYKIINTPRLVKRHLLDNCIEKTLRKRVK